MELINLYQLGKERDQGNKKNSLDAHFKIIHLIKKYLCTTAILDFEPIKIKL